MTNKELSETEAFALDVAKRTIYTGVESAAAAGTLLYSSGGIDLSDPHKALATVAVGVGGAFLAAIRTSLATAFGKGGKDRKTGLDLLREDIAVIKNKIDKVEARVVGVPIDGSVSQLTPPPLVTGTATKTGGSLDLGTVTVTVAGGGAGRPQPGPGTVPDNTAPVDAPVPTDDGTAEALPADSAVSGNDDSAESDVEAPVLVDDSDTAGTPEQTQVVYDASGNALGYVAVSEIKNGASE